MAASKCLMNYMQVSLLFHINEENKLPDGEKLGDYDITLGIDSSKMPKTQSKARKTIFRN